MKDNSAQSGITLFSIPKAFKGHNKVIQLNAIRSWTLLQPKCEIIVFGNDEGTAEVAADLGLTHIPEVERNEYNTPLVSSLFLKAQQLSHHNNLCYINADIILLNDFLPALNRVNKSSFLIVGQRWDLDIDYLLDYSDSNWETTLKDLLRKEGKLHPKTGIDYFAFPRGLYASMPPFAIGRGSWDNWLLFRARELKTPIIDATGAITAIHENHDYSHLRDGADHFTKGIEMKPNLEMAGGADHLFSLEYATHLLKTNGVRMALSPRHLFFRMTAIPFLHPRLHFLAKPMKTLTRAIVSIRSMLHGR
ncbi:MAG TPA: hypothetical protein VMB24_04195 [Dehalococcoidales bacterium]|nr:hypothetical protein [Dehalococcoidales bacterium]